MKIPYSGRPYTYCLFGGGGGISATSLPRSMPAQSKDRAQGWHSAQFTRIFNLPV